MVLSEFIQVSINYIQYKYTATLNCNRASTLGTWQVPNNLNHAHCYVFGLVNIVGSGLVLVMRRHLNRIYLLLIEEPLCSTFAYLFS